MVAQLDALPGFLQLVVWHLLAIFLAFNVEPKRKWLIAAVFAFACMNLANYYFVKNIFFSWAIFGAVLVVLVAFGMAIFSKRVQQGYQSVRGMAERRMARIVGGNSGMGNAR